MTKTENIDIDDVDLTANKNRALCLLAAGYQKKEVVKELGIGEVTLRNWTKEPQFKKKLREAVAASYDAAIAELCSGSREAAQELKRIISDPDVSARVKISAISTLLTNAEKAKTSLLEDRLEALENMINSSSQVVNNDNNQG